jgi:hypothetical protein
MQQNGHNRIFNNHANATYAHLKLFLNLTITIAALCSGTKAYACAACGCTLSRNWDNQGISSTSGFSADFSYDYLKQDQQRYGNDTASSALIDQQLAAGQEVEAYTETQTMTASLNYTADTWGINTQLPLVKRDHATYGTTAPMGADYTSSSASGIGDIRIIARYTGLTTEKNAGLIAGVKLPTGSTNANFNAGTHAGDPLDAGLQIGTGSTDVILGAFYTGTISTYGWFVQGTLQHAVATKSQNGADYRPGDAYTFNSGIRYASFGARTSPMLQLNIIKREADTDNNTGVNVAVDPVTGVSVSGGTLVYLAPGVTVRVGGGASVYGFIQLPVYQEVNSLQIVPQYTLTLGVRLAFE